MPAAKNRTDLLAANAKEYARLRATLETVDAGLAEATAEDDEITIKDTIAHRTHWIELFLGWYRDGQAGKPVQTPAPGYKWNQLKDYNARVRAASRSISWPKVLDGLERAHGDLTALLTRLDDTELYTPRIHSWTNNWTLGRWAEASGASHYRSANAYIRKILRTVEARSRSKG